MIDTRSQKWNKKQLLCEKNATEVSHIRLKIRPKRKKRRLKSVPKRTKKLFVKVRTDTYEYALSGEGERKDCADLVLALMPSLFSLQIYDTFSQRGGKKGEKTLRKAREGALSPQMRKQKFLRPSYLQNFFIVKKSLN